MLKQPKARARNSDPEPSHNAARTVERKGKAARQRDEVLKGVQRWGENTAAELADLMKVDRYMTSRRLPELREAGLVVNPKDGKGKPKTRMCRVVKSMSMTWRLPDPPKDPQLRLL